jgi:O-antigen/teichoic acid export membrane protein
MFRKVINAASWLSLVQVMNMLSVIVLSIFVIRRTDPAQVSAYMYAVFVTDAVMAYTLLQIAQRITLARDETSFRQLFAYSRTFGMANGLVAVLVVGVVVLFSEHTGSTQTLSYIAWLSVAGLANYFAQICFSVCDYTFDYKSFGVSSALSNVLSLVLAVAVFLLGGGIFSMVLRDVARGLILLALGLRTTRALAPQLKDVEPLDRQSRLRFFGFLAKRHTLKMIEVSNHRVPALVMTTGNLASLGQFGVAFQFVSQIMNVLTIAGDKVAYALFSREGTEGRRKYLGAVIALYAVTGLMVFLFGKHLFLLVYGNKWLESSQTFSYLGLYLFTHGTLVVVTNFLITQHRFAGVYVAWAGWTATFVTCYLLDRSWPIVTYYLTASAVSCVLVLGALLLTRVRKQPDAVHHPA